MRVAAWGAAFVLMAAGCATTLPPDQLVNSKVAIRSAREAGAMQVPGAARHLKLAEQEAAYGQVLLKSGEPDEARNVLMRAIADADLARALALEVPAKQKTGEARERLKAMGPESGTPTPETGRP